MLEHPRMMYHKDGRTETALTPEHEASFDGEWSPTPGEVHRRLPNGAASGTVQPVHPSNQDDMVERIADRVVEKLMAATPPVASNQPARRGRPPKSLSERSASRTGEADENDENPENED